MKWLDKYEDGGMLKPVKASPMKLSEISKIPKPKVKEDSNLENILEIVDPTGITSWDDIYRSYNETGMSPQTAMEVFGAIPMLGKVGKVGKLAQTAANTFAVTSRQKRNAKAVAETLKAVGKFGPGAGRVTDSYQAYDQWENGGKTSKKNFLEPNSWKLPKGTQIPFIDSSTELAASIGGEDGEPAYLIPTFKHGKPLLNPYEEYRKTGDILGGPFKTWQEAEKFGELRHKYVEEGKPLPTPLKWWGDVPKAENGIEGTMGGLTDQGFNYNGAWGGQFAMGGSLPGSVGFTYARTQGAAPANGPYAKKTLPSAQNGKHTPIYTDNPKDPRIKAYNDSLKLYNKTKDIQNPKYYNKGEEPSWYNWKGDLNKADAFMRRNNIDVDYEYHRNGKFPGKIQPVKVGDFGEGMAYPIYKKPIQPVIYKKPEPIQPVTPTKMLEQVVQQPLVQPQLKEYSGNPVYANTPYSRGAGALIGFENKGDTTYIAPEDYERFAVPSYGKKIIESRKKQRNGGINKADEAPIEKLDQLLNFTNYNKPTKGGWLDKY